MQAVVLQEMREGLLFKKDMGRFVRLSGEGGREGGREGGGKGRREGQ